MPSINISQEDFAAVAGAAMDAMNRGDDTAAHRLDKVARKISAALSDSAPQMQLSGEKAYALFTSTEPFPLSSFLDEWRKKGLEASGFVVAVVRAYDGMVRLCSDGRYNGVIRKG